MKITPSSTGKEKEVSFYHTENVSKLHNKDRPKQYLFEEDEHYEQQAVMVQNARSLGAKAGPTEQPGLKARVEAWFKEARPSFISCAAVAGSGIYFQHMVFYNVTLKYAYMCVLILYPIIVLVLCCHEANRLRKIAVGVRESFKDSTVVEGDAKDVMRKATVTTAERRATISRLWMPFLLLSGWYKMLSPADFKKQIWQGYVLESLCFAVPVTVLQGLNNQFLSRWELKTYAFLLVNMGILFLNKKAVDALKAAGAKAAAEAGRKKEMAELMKKRQRGPGASVEDVLVKDEAQEKAAKE